MNAPRLRVLLVSSDADTLVTLTRSLQRHQRFDVTTATSMDDALRIVRTGLPDAVLITLALSMIDGHALLHLVRQTPGLARLPIFVLTGRPNSAAIQAAARAGASGFIPQPLNGAEIAYKIEQAVHGRSARAAEVVDLLRPDPAPVTPARNAAP